MAITISCASIKGGCSKTTTAINLAAALAEKQYRCLVVDFDPQANASMALNIPIAELKYSVTNVLMPIRGLEKQPIEKAILKTDFDHLHIVPASMHLSLARLVLNSEVARESVLRKELQKPIIQNNYDFIIIDTAPSVDILLLNALAASNYVIGCSTCEYLALTGIEMMLDSFNQIKDSNINSEIKFLGVIATKYNNTKHAKEALKTLEARYDVLGCTRTSTKANEATSEGIPVVYNAKNNAVSQEYKRIADYLIEQYDKELL